MDMWSAGVTLYMMLTKEYPFDLQNIAECLAQMRENRPNLEGKIENQNVKELLSKLLSNDPEERPSAREILEYQWLLSKVRDHE